MKIAAYHGQELKWLQPNTMKMEYELRSGDDVVARLVFRSSFGTLANTTSEDGCWTFKRIGFFQTRVTIRECDSEKDLAVFKNNTWSDGGTLVMADGRKLLASTNFWNTEYDFKTENGDMVVRFKKIGGVLHISSMVEFGPGFANYMEAPWIVMLGWYLTVMMQMDTTAAVMATTVVAP